MITSEFLGAGKAIFTVSNPKGERYTFKVRKKKDTPYFVSLLTGPDNYSNYTYMGCYVPKGDGYPVLKLTRSSKYNDGSVPVRVFRWAIQIVHGIRQLPTGYTIHHEGKCGRCGRRLTVPSSIESGFGPECIKMK